MTTINQLRAAALALPEAEETTHFGMVAFAVRKRTFVVMQDDGVVQLHLPDDAADAALAAHASGERLVRMGTPIGIRLPLQDVNGKDLNTLVRAAWRNRAPKRLAASLDAIDAGEVPAHSDLPPGIGKPATRGLLTAGIVTLADVARRSRSELLALHGVGPKAVDLLAEVLADRGQELRP